MYKQNTANGVDFHFRYYSNIINNSTGCDFRDRRVTIRRLAQYS